MYCPSGDRLGLQQLNSVEWSDTSCSLTNFLDCHGKTLPHVVRVQEGFCGDASSWTIDSGQILILHSLHRETKIIAKDSKHYDVYIPRKFQVKVEMIPKNAVEEYSTIRDLLRTFPNYFRVLDDIPSHQLRSESIFQIIPHGSRSNDSMECIQIGPVQKYMKTIFPLSLKGRFQPLLDSREFFVDEVYSEVMDNPDSLPLTVRFVKAPNVCTQGINELSLNELGNIRLVGECVTESVFATVINGNEKTLSVFPKKLLITVEAAKNNSAYKDLRESISETQERTIKRMERLNQLALYQGRNPIRQFPVVNMLPPSLPKPRSHSTREESEERSSLITKKRSYSTPPLPPKTQTMKATKQRQDTDTAKKALTPTASLQLCRSPPQGNPNRQNHPSPKHQPPPPSKVPLLPPKTKCKPSQETAPIDCSPSNSTTNTQASKPQTPLKPAPVPPPRKRREKTTKPQKTCDDGEIIAPIINHIETIDDKGYIRMDHDLEERQSLDYEPMSMSWITQDNKDDSNMTLGEIFDCVTSSEGDSEDSPSHRRHSHDYENTKELNLEISSASAKDGMDDHDNENINAKDNPDVSSGKSLNDAEDHDYENAKELDISFPKSHVCKEGTGNRIAQKQSTSMESLDEVPSQDTQRHRKRASSYEYITPLKLGPPRRTTSVNVESCETTDAPNMGEHVGKLRSHGYENTSYLNFKQRETADTKEHSSALNNKRNRAPHYENTKFSLNEESSAKIKNSSLEENPNKQQGMARDENSLSKHTVACTSTKSEQIIQKSSKKRLSPIGMEQDCFHQEIVYTAMNENNNIDSAYKDIDHYSLYTSMDDSYNPSIYENTSSDEGTSKRESQESYYYEPLSLLDGKTEPTDLEERGTGVGSTTDSELHYYDVEISSIISSSPRQRIPSDHPYEDVDIPFTASSGDHSQDTVTSPRPIPPQRRRPGARKTDPTREETVFDVNENLLSSPPRTLLHDKINSIAIQDSEPSNSTDFEDLDDCRLFLAKKESVEQELFERAVKHRATQIYNSNDNNTCGSPNSNAEKDVKSRPPAPPPKKPLNYIKVETKSENTDKTFKKKPPTKYSEVDTRPRQYSKADDMEYVDDIDLFLSGKQNTKVEQERKEERRTSKIIDICKPIKSFITKSHDSEKTQESHKPLVYSRSSPATDITRKAYPKDLPSVPPPKPKRLFLKSDPEQTQRRPHTTSSWKSCINDQTGVSKLTNDRPPSQAHQHEKASVKKPPKPVPRKAVSKTDLKLS